MAGPFSAHLTCGKPPLEDFTGEMLDGLSFFLGDLTQGQGTLLINPDFKED